MSSRTVKWIKGFIFVSKTPTNESEDLNTRKQRPRNMTTKTLKQEIEGPETQQQSPLKHENKFKI